MQPKHRALGGWGWVQHLRLVCCRVVWQSTGKAVHTQGGAHTRRSVATAGVLLFKGGAGASPLVERSELSSE